MGVCSFRCGWFLRDMVLKVCEGGNGSGKSVVMGPPLNCAHEKGVAKLAGNVACKGGKV